MTLNQCDSSFLIPDGDQRHTKTTEIQSERKEQKANKCFFDVSKCRHVQTVFASCILVPQIIQSCVILGLEVLEVLLDVLCSFYVGTCRHFIVLLMYVGDAF